MAATVSLLEALSPVLKAAKSTAGFDGAVVDSLLVWCESERGRAWLSDNVINTEEFAGLCKKGGDDDDGKQAAAVERLLEKCISSSGDDAPPVGVGAVVEGVRDAYTKDSEGPLAVALLKLKHQLPMIAALQKTLGMLPPAFAKMVDANAATMGQAVRTKQAEAGGGPVSAQDMLQTVLGNPAFAEMVTAMMDQAPEDDLDEEAIARARADEARHRLNEHRLRELEKKVDALTRAMGGAHPAPELPKKTTTTAVRNKKRQGGRTNNSTPTY